ncbi:Hsp20/alpha crystallin family protein [Pseudothermotoga thermarum]|uniref:Heat shock protein Hsp20 n=1 Tax=Pseudothermotoga thermarum DSM 5069 TaxID=688269 RepID=F7YTE4_9THEM|nr:Hsp20/alpha crystallin family protein [Pseudothermotoga thermarum]AEH50122.1 heat shock protein Hsp20 [Pseudothermotoga thermarum DSM 5069]
MLLERREDFFKPLRQLQREIDRLFEDFFAPVTRRTFEVGFVPEIDVYETDKELMIEVEVPGMDKKDIKVKVEDGVLRICGEKKLEREKSDRNYHVVERSYGKFERAIRLPDYVDAEKIKARYENGVLTISIPKKEEKKAKVVDVEVE